MRLNKKALKLIALKNCAGVIYQPFQETAYVRNVGTPNSLYYNGHMRLITVASVNFKLLITHEKEVISF